MPKTIAEINERIRKRQAVVVTAEEIIDLVDEKGPQRAAAEVDVVTTGTFGPMCSSGAYFNIGHAKPRIKLGGGHAYLNGVPAYVVAGESLIRVHTETHGPSMVDVAGSIGQRWHLEHLTPVFDRVLELNYLYFGYTRFGCHRSPFL